MKWTEVYKGRHYRAGAYRIVRWRGFLARYPGRLKRMRGFLVYYNGAEIADVRSVAHAKRVAEKHNRNDEGGWRSH